MNSNGETSSYWLPNPGVHQLGASSYCLKRSNTGTNKLEVHELGGTDDFQEFFMLSASALGQSDARNFAFALEEYNLSGAWDLFCLKKTGADTGTLEVHVLNGADNYQTFLLHTGTPSQGR